MQGQARDADVGWILGARQTLTGDSRQPFTGGGIDGHILERAGGIQVAVQNT